MVTECQRSTVDVYKVVADVAKEEDCVRLVTTAVEKLGGLDILILNAAHVPELQWFSSDSNMVGNGRVVMHATW